MIICDYESVFAVFTESARGIRQDGPAISAANRKMAHTAPLTTIIPKIKPGKRATKCLGKLKIGRTRIEMLLFKLEADAKCFIFVISLSLMSWTLS